ncbi:Guanine nucleotide-binding protein alpha-3subunit [Clathrus columnatus]|uniref:Guanine nucleotide-binding protein subunit alpha n=1 Tax=Clathrus columnatus TaxID=1419009 RepID=A0AAV5A4D5_9AGAM|nr:Guanine nucleotide-binding protein alpha-3subunit [Clathrus columnatus]
MGACQSAPMRAEKERSDTIDKQIEEDHKKSKKECKILLLGSGESGKSTIVKQMKIIHQEGYKPEELIGFRPVVYENLMESAHTIVSQMRKMGLSPEKEEYNAHVDLIGEYSVQDDPDFRLSPDIAQAIHQICQDPVLEKILEHTSDFYLMDSATYFFDEVLRIGDPEYVPTETDVLRARRKTSGIAETKFSMGQLSIHMFDVGGQRSERKKWIHCFESVTSIIFCTALSEYDQVLLEENRQIDVFKQKIPRVPLERYFQEYTGGPDINKAAKYILWRFMQKNRARLSVYPHLTQATDTGNVRLVFAAVKETILQNALKDSGIL